MPLIKITSSVEVPADKREAFLAAVSKTMSAATGKPERVMMVVLDAGSVMLDTKSGPGAYADVRAIGGLTPEVNAKITAQVCALLKQWLSIPGERVYLTFTEVAATNWGHNGKTFG